MTGFGSAEGVSSWGQFRVEIRSVNHRHFDVRWHVPGAFQAQLSELENVVRERVGRGRVDGTLTLGERRAAAGVSVNLDQARAYWRAAEDVRSALEIEEPPSLAWLLQNPGVLVGQAAFRPTPEDEAAVRSAAEAAVNDLLAMRREEGGALHRELVRHVESLRRLRDEVAARVQESTGRRKVRLEQRLRELLDDVAVEPQRLAQEVAILADRSDVTEELERLAGHFDHFLKLMGVEDPVGRRLDFLIQEMNREANTIGSKAADERLAHLVVDLKAELERIREQVQNIE